MNSAGPGLGLSTAIIILLRHARHRPPSGLRINSTAPTFAKAPLLHSGARKAYSPKHTSSDRP